MTAYAASKAGMASMAEVVRLGLDKNSQISVTTLLPGYIRTELNEHKADQLPFLIEADHAVGLMADALQREPVKAVIPRWPWAPMTTVMPFLPASVIRRLSTG